MTHSHFLQMLDAALIAILLPGSAFLWLIVVFERQRKRQWWK